MIVATMSRQTKRAFLRLCAEKRRKKKNSGSKGLKTTVVGENIQEKLANSSKQA